MKHLIPNFIQHHFDRFQLNGAVEASVLFVDLTGFTPLTETLMDKGSQGAEELSNILNEIFEPIVSLVYNRQGFIPYFAGDSFAAIFPYDQKDGAQGAVQALWEVALGASHYFIQRDYQFGGFTIGLKIGLSLGEVDWGIVGQNNRAFYFRGHPIDASAEAQEMAKSNNFDIVFDDGIYQFLESKTRKYIKELTPGYYYLSKPLLEPPTQYPKVEVPEIRREIAAQFLPDSVLDYTQDGEFRTVTSIFISFSEVEDHRLLNRFSGLVLELIANFSGYFKEIEFGDKGGVMVCFFGAPVVFENNVDRALEFVYALRLELNELIRKYPFKYRIGMTTGIAYTGIIGGKERSQYGAVGNRVNLAARLMMYADWDEILVDTIIQKNRNFHFHPKGKIKYKGIKGPVPTFKLVGRKEVLTSDFEGGLVGRDFEMKDLLDFSDPLFAGKAAGVAYIYGEAGVGKSRLAHELKKALESTGKVQWFTCQTDEILRKSFNPFIFFLRSYFKQSLNNSAHNNADNFEQRFNLLQKRLEDSNHKNADIHLQELLRTKSVLAALIGIVYLDSLWEQLDARGRYQNTISAIINLLLSEAAIKPTVLQLEDGHWLEANSFELLNELIRQIADYPLLVLITSRYSDSGNKPTFFDHSAADHQDIPSLAVDLDLLHDKAAKELVELKLEGSISTYFFDILKRTTNSNPFYLQQLLDYFQEQDLLIKKHGQWTLRHEDIQLSDSINTVLTARIDRLSPLVKETVKTAAVIGREFDVQILKEVMRFNDEFISLNGNAPKLLKEQVDIAEEVQIWQSLNEVRYIFTYSLLREAAYSMQLRTRLQTIHRHVAEAIERIYAHQLEARYVDLAFHYEKADIFDKTCEYLRKAADHARNNYQNQRALEFYEKLLHKLGDQSALVQQIRTYLKKGRVLELIGEWDQSEEAYLKALDLAKKDRDALLLGQAHNRMGSVKLLKGEYIEGKRYLTAAEQLFESIDDTNGIADVKGNLGNLFFRQGKYKDAKKAFLKSINLSSKTQKDSVNPQIVSNLGLTYMNQGEYDAGIKVQEDHLQLYEKKKDKQGMAILFTFLGIVYLEKGDYDHALEKFEKGLKLNTELGNKQLNAIAIGNIGIVYERKGDYEQAMQHYVRDLELCEELGDKQGTAIALGLIGQLLNVQGEFFRAIEYLQKDLMICEELGYQKGIAKAVNTLGDIFYYLGQYERSLHFYDRAIEVTRKIGNKLVLGFSLVEKGTVLLETNDRFELKKVAEEAQTIARDLGNPDLIYEAELLGAKTLLQDQQLALALQKLETLRENFPTIDQQAPTYFELAKIVPDNASYRQKALELYEELYAATPRFTYKNRMDRLRET